MRNKLVEFDITSDLRFRDSLQALDATTAAAAVNALKKINNTLTWKEFVSAHGWDPIEVVGDSSSPGAPDYFFFSLSGAGVKVQIGSFCLAPEQVTCMIARLPPAASTSSTRAKA